MSESAPPAEEKATSVQKIQTLLSAKDDTSRFVGLALLKSVLDNTPELRNDEQVIIALWASIPPKFLERLMKSGSGEKKQSDDSRKDSNDMLDLAVSVLHTFAALLPESSNQDPKLLDRIPQLVACLLHCSDETTRLTLETLVSLVSRSDGARVFTTVEDLSPLTEIASSQPLALDTLLYAWLNAAAEATDKNRLRSKIDSTIGSLVASFKGTDAVTLLSFLASLLPKLDPEVLPPNPKWLPAIGTFIRNLVTSRPTAAGRAAFTNLSAALLELYPFQAPPLLFADQDATTAGTAKSSSTSNPFSYLLINLILVDLRATLPTLLSQLNTPDYPPTAQRLTSAFNIISHFIGYLLRALDSPESSSALITITPDRLLSLRKSLSETLSLTTEYLRDRWDAAVAGTMGLHPDARTGAAVVAPTTGAAHFALAWDSKGTDVAASDPLVLAAVRALALWAREDDGEVLRAEVSGLADMLVDLYRESTSSGGGVGGDKEGENGRRVLDFRRAVLVAFEGVVAERKGREAVLDNGGWEALAEDLVGILEASSSAGNGDDESESARGVEIVRVLMQLAEEERPGPREAWMDLVTRVAAWDVPEVKQSPMTEECQVAVLQLVTTLLANTHPGVQKRYVHSTSAVLGIAHQLKGKVRGDRALEEALEDVVGTLAALR
ncbi:Neurochondrin-domain-containing protein [Corynascus novoguineensis]|uniref:Neurochondrin-domain-containing protein n=1 Tax=Corynascus novoguineensis TaxID=1126955 RepID=A0AAN7CU57_9PEZI|nr:Neurochondrin-domain-containing protein [Corynascus novoguineensis]